MTNLSPNGLGLLERELLIFLGELCGVSPDPSLVGGDELIPTARIAEELSRLRAIFPRYTREALTGLAQDWWSPISLLNKAGNWGDADSPTTTPDIYTAVALSPLGRVAALAETNQGLPLPLGLILGNIYAGGTAPPFHPHRVIEALLALDRDESQQSATTALGLLGTPFFPTCLADGDIVSLLAGKPAMIKLTAPITVGPGTTIHVRGHTPSAGIMTITDTIRHAASARSNKRVVHDPQPDSILGSDNARFYGERGMLPIREISNLTSRGQTDLELVLQPEADAEQVVSSLQEIWPIGVDLECHLAGPWVELARQWIDCFHRQNKGDQDLEHHLRTHLTSDT